MLWAACTLGFFAFLRSGEFTAVPGGHHVLQAADVRVDSHQSPTFISITLRGSKTDPFGAGCTLYVGHTQTHICPVTAVLAYLSVRAPGPGPLFCHADALPYHVQLW